MTGLRRGMVLAAGFGTRLRPVTNVLPKALLPIAGEPLLVRILRWLGREGVAAVAVNAHHLADALARGLEEATRLEAGLPEVRLFREREILGTGGGIAHASEFLRNDPGDDPVVVANADQIFEVELQRPLGLHRAERPIATLLLARDPRRAQVRLDGVRVLEIAPRPVYGNPALWAFTGVYLLSAEGIDRLRRRASAGGEVGFLDLLPELRAWMREGRLAGCAYPDEPFREIGSPEAWLELLRESAPEGGSWIHPHVAIPPDAAVEESIILPGVRVAPGARVRRSILAAGAVAEGLVDRVIAAGGERRTLALLARDEEADLERFLRGARPAEARASAPATAAPYTLRRLHGGGSSRRILRVAYPQETRILVLPAVPSAAAASIYPTRPGAPSEAESYRYVNAYLAAQGVRVPRLFAYEAESGRMLLEDLGDVRLADLPWSEDDANATGPARRAYEEAVDLLIRMQSQTDPPFDPARTHNPEYDERFILRYEAGYFLREMAVRHCGLVLSPEETGELLEECRGWARRALADAPRVLVHRDFQSRNLMVTPRGLAVIDVQGARLGPPEYDLASLVEDPYADLPTEGRDDLIARYRAGIARAAEGRGLAFSRPRYEACLVNRLLQALGAFAYLGGALGKPGFLEHAPAAIRTLRTRGPLAGSRLQRVLDRVEARLATGVGLSTRPE